MSANLEGQKTANPSPSMLRLVREHPAWAFLAAVLTVLGAVELVVNLVAKAGWTASLAISAGILAVALVISVIDDVRVRAQPSADPRRVRELGEELSDYKRTLNEVVHRHDAIAVPFDDLNHDWLHIGKDDDGDSVYEQHETTANDSHGLFWRTVSACSSTALALAPGDRLTLTSAHAEVDVQEARAADGGKRDVHTSLLETFGDQKRCAEGIVIFHPKIAQGEMVKWRFKYSAPGLWSGFRTKKQDTYKVTLSSGEPRYEVTFVFDDPQLQMADVSCVVDLPPGCPATVAPTCTRGPDAESSRHLHWEATAPPAGEYKFTLRRS